MFNQRQPMSSYLAQATQPTRQMPNINWVGMRATLVAVSYRNPKLLKQSLIALAVWCSCVAALQNLTGAPQASLFSLGGVAPIAGGRLASTAIHAPVLPGGPSGQMLPPGTLAPDNTYKNTYVRGQCTWYVAGRRQVPKNWGNAVSWYYRASASGWSVGPTPAVAAIAWTPAGRYGHVALVEQISPDGAKVYISEMNYRVAGVKTYRWVPANQFKYIY